MLLARYGSDPYFVACRLVWSHSFATEPQDEP